MTISKAYSIYVTPTPTQTWAKTLNLEAQETQRSWRNVIAAGTATASGAWIRITIKGHSSVEAQATHVSIGVRDGTSADTLATPVEIKFAGASGVTTAAGGTSVSDWTLFTFDEAVDHILIYDYVNNKGETRMTSGGDGSYYRTGDNSWNVADVSSYTLQSGYQQMFSKIEVYSGPLVGKIHGVSMSAIAKMYGVTK